MKTFHKVVKLLKDANCVVMYKDGEIVIDSNNDVLIRNTLKFDSFIGKIDGTTVVIV